MEKKNFIRNLSKIYVPLTLSSMNKAWQNMYHKSQESFSYVLYNLKSAKSWAIKRLWRSGVRAVLRKGKSTILVQNVSLSFTFKFMGKVLFLKNFLQASSETVTASFVLWIFFLYNTWIKFQNNFSPTSPATQYTLNVILRVFVFWKRKRKNLRYGKKNSHEQKWTTIFFLFLR